MKTSESIVKITPAFLSAQKNIESVIKDSNNPFFKSKYADLSAVIEACKDKLNTEGIAILQPIDGMSVETILVHTSGEWFSSSTPIVVKDENNPQALGSAITYAKRYGLQSMVLLPAEDDDGNKASTNKPVVNKNEIPDPTDEFEPLTVPSEHFCEIHSKEMKSRGKGVWDHRMKLNNNKEYDENGMWHWCQGHGWKLSTVQ